MQNKKDSYDKTLAICKLLVDVQALYGFFLFWSLGLISRRTPLTIKIVTANDVKIGNSGDCDIK